MTRDDEERAIRRAFAALREDDRRHTPNFDRLLSRPATSPRTRATGRRAILAAAVLVALVTVAGLWWLLPSAPMERAEEDATGVSLASWQAPTDVLLETPGRSLFVELPAVGGSGFLPPTASGRPTNGVAGSLKGRKENTP